ncbi:MAG: PorV/PorQ family protein [Endomicrobia bacterium]|nr:PorV/PorQ family protein [Endomicrobiia bacterium]
MKKTFGILLLITVFLFVSVAANGAAKGTTVLSFLQMPAGARYIAMGGAGTAFVEDSTSMYWNPALLARSGANSVDFMHSTYVEDSSYDYASFEYKLKGVSAIGFAMQYFSYGKVDSYDEFGNETGSINPYDLAISAGYAVNVKGFGIGVSAKMIRSEIVDEVYATALDVGLRLPEMLDNKFLLGFAVTNISEGVKYGEETEKLPMTARLGAAYCITDNLLTAADIGFSYYEDEIYAALGAEYELKLLDSVSMLLRAGYNTMSDIGGVAGLTAGFGIRVKSLMIDYAFVPMGDFGDTHRVSLSYFWF